ncbi:MAG: HAD family phosphatase [Candidatus Cloacimonadota bacterium]|nr:HAD family phosphatase [Candidatus Cloacimonadota bacterium]
MIEINKVKAVIFDLDGTLIESMDIWHQIDENFLQKRGFAIPKELFQDVENGNSMREIAIYFKKKFNLNESISQIMKEWNSMAEKYYREKIKLKPQVAEFLEILHRKGIRIGLGTSNSEFLAKLVLQSNEVLHLFDIIVTGSRKIRGKPFPDIFLKITKKLNVHPAECVVFEDTIVGIDAAKNAGMKVVAVYDEFSKKEWKEIKLQADFHIYEFKDIEKLFSIKF